MQLVVNGRINGSIIYSSGEVQAGGGKARLATDGNIYGEKWGNQWLDVYLRNTYQPKGSYTPAGQAYTKAESDGRYYTKAQSDAGYNAKNTASLSTAGGWQQDGTTGLIIQMGTVNRTGYNTAVNFPKAFPNFCMGVLLTLSDAGTGNLSDSSSNIRSLSHSKTGFNYGANGNPEKRRSGWHLVNGIKI